MTAVALILLAAIVVMLVRVERAVRELVRITRRSR